MNERNKCSAFDKDDLPYKAEYPTPSNNEQAKMIFEAIQEDNKLEINKQSNLK